MGVKMTTFFKEDYDLFTFLFMWISAWIWQTVINWFLPNIFFIDARITYWMALLLYIMIAGPPYKNVHLIQSRSPPEEKW